VHPLRQAAVIVVRPIDPERDADAVAEALVDSSIHHTSLEPGRYEVLDPATVAADYRRGRQHPSGTPAAERATLVAELDGRLVGFVDVRVAHPGGSHRPLRYGYVAEIAVAAPARRRGVGAELLRAAEAWARERGCTYAVLDYNVHNDDARRFYRDKMGYRPAGEIVLKEL
jgi:ribosomal protein S18 acetylase RimI-like enzyme